MRRAQPDCSRCPSLVELELFALKFVDEDDCGSWALGAFVGGSIPINSKESVSDSDSIVAGISTEGSDDTAALEGASVGNSF